MNAEQLAIKERLDFLLSDLQAARQQELFNAAKVIAQEIAHNCSVLALIKEQQEQERAWTPLPNIRASTVVPVIPWREV